MTSRSFSLTGRLPWPRSSSPHPPPRIRHRRAARVRAERRLGQHFGNRYDDRQGRRDAEDRSEAARHRRVRRRRAAVHQRPDGQCAHRRGHRARRGDRTCRVGDSPSDLSLPDGRWIAAAIEENDQVLLVDTGTNKSPGRSRCAARTRNTPCGARTASALRERGGGGRGRHCRRRQRRSDQIGEGRDRPRGIGFLPDGSRAYVAAENADTVNVFDVATHQ